LDLPVQIQFLFVLFFTIIGCFVAFEGIRQVRVLRILFGLKVKTP